MHQFEDKQYEFKDDDEEKQHWWQVMRTFLFYSDFCDLELERRQKHLNRLPEKYAAKLPEQTFARLKDLQLAIDENQSFFEDMVYFHASSGFSQPPAFIQKLLSSDDPAIDKKRCSYPQKDIGPPVDARQQHRNQAVLHSLLREWSAEGAEERSQSFGVLVNELQIRKPLQKKDYSTRVLVPGCGLGRLPLEIASLGYACEGNEYSAFMAIASNFMINSIVEPNSYILCPWVSNLCNIVYLEDTVETVEIPDVCAVQLLEVSNDKKEEEYPFPKFSMAAGNFVEIYGNQDNEGKWDAVVTCFFLDTAPVAMEYIETIYGILKPGGVWINLGPLLYHWVADVDANHDDRYNQSVELTYEELKHVIQQYGFQYLNEEWKDCQYTRCRSSMMWTNFRCVLFTVQKPDE